MPEGAKQTSRGVGYAIRVPCGPAPGGGARNSASTHLGRRAVETEAGEPGYRGWVGSASQRARANQGVR
jgi:hypothetical protein